MERLADDKMDLLNEIHNGEVDLTDSDLKRGSKKSKIVAYLVSKKFIKSKPQEDPDDQKEFGNYYVLTKVGKQKLRNSGGSTRFNNEWNF